MRKGFARRAVAPIAIAGLVACGHAAGTAGTGSGGGSATASASGPGATTTGSSTSTASGGGASQAAGVAAQLGRSAHFLIGMGNDLAGADQNYDHSKDGAYTLGVTLDLHYCYLSGLLGSGGWPDWNADGSFVNIMTDSADAQGVVPMFTLYAMAASGEANTTVLTDDGYMQPYWDGAKLLFQRLAIFGKPAVVHLEPDWWAFAQQASGGDPATLPAHVGSLAPDCAGLSEDVAGMGQCLLRLARMYAPKAVVGFHASRWAGTPTDTIAFLGAIGAADADIVVADPLDRDAGCFEAHVDPNCQRNDGPWYWDETNQTTPNFHEYLDWSKAIADGLHRPMIWWQIPFGVPSDTPGGTAGHYRDNRVHYLFSHVGEFIAAGGLGAAFGTGAANQTYITTDGGQFQSAVTSYFGAPTPLP